MIKHIVCHKIPSINAAQEAAKMLNALYGHVPSLLSICAGVDVLKSTRSYELGIIAEFTDLQGLAEYNVHPEHVKVKEYIAGVKDPNHTSVAVDFEI